MLALLQTILPSLVVWLVAACLLLRRFGGRRAALVGGASGALLGAFVPLVLTSLSSADAPFAGVRAALAFALIALVCVSVGAFYRAGGVGGGAARFARLGASAPVALAACLAAGVAAGTLVGFRLAAPTLGTSLTVALLGAAMVGAAHVLERRLSARFSPTASSAALFVIATLLLSASFSARLDLFAPLSMKVMKFTHDIVHKTFEALLIPDHLFVRAAVWNYVGVLFGNTVGFWVGLIIWFVPPVFVTWAIARTPLPALSHLRRGAERRKLLAEYLRQRRYRLLVPLAAGGLLGWAVYASSHPTVAYWDPRPIEVKATGVEVVVPLSTDAYDLRDGKLHKFVYHDGTTAVRFFVLQKPDGTMTADLDACAICQPDGYGQGDGVVICYYCKTLIPIETVGARGGCNPVVLPAVVTADGVHIQTTDLLAAWATVPRRAVEGAR
jgi:hypothetical protein